MFSVGEKVVYVGTCNDQDVCIPERYEIVTIESFCKDRYGNAAADIKEYLYAKDGCPQAFLLDTLRKLDHTFAEELTARIEEEINQDQLQLI